jgi:hypothetical protein
MGAYGSPEYALTWKEQAMPSGPPISRLRALAHRTSDSGSTGLRGWPIPMAGTPAQKEAGNTDSSRKTVAVLKGWATPRARDHKGNGVSIARAAKGIADSLDLQCKLVSRSGMDPQSPLGARMERGGYRLNPIHSLWLMGFPAEWASYAPLATRSTRSSQRNSSRQ